ncbi:transcription repressor OFP6-like [Aristolochia californica]|uniref:transcription repressor OFP6-like n=1 Tax=Aristolochia californica TaxID=171875 RepID=UPI0035DC4516
MSSTRRKLLRKPVVVNVGCGCRRPKLSDVFHWKPKPAKVIYGRRNQVYQASSSSSWEKGALSIDENDEESTGTVSLDISPHYYPHQPGKTSKPPAKRSGRIRESVAVVKESDDPYLDFRQSMLQMILEKEIYARDDLRELLNCFLSLNSPQHHQIIIRAFTEIWNGVYSAPRAEFDVRGRSRARGSSTYGDLG